MKKNHLLFKGALLLALSTLNSPLSTSLAQTSAFSVQGRINTDGTNANGLYDIRLSLHAAPAGGIQVTGPVLFANVRVTNGIFSVSPDFGRSVFDGADRWLQTEVSPAGANAFTNMGRQQILSAPYSTYANKAANVASGSVVTSLNNLKDGVSLVGSGGVTVIPGSNNSLVIGFPGGGSSNGIWSLSGSTAYYNGNVRVGAANSTDNSRFTVSTPDLFGFGQDYGFEHTDGLVRLATYLDGEAGWLGTASHHPMKFFAGSDAGSTPSMTLDTLGHVLIGTSALDSDAKLTVGNPGYGITHTDGTVSLSTYVSEAFGQVPAGGWIGTRSLHSLHFFVHDGMPSMTVDTAGNVGIGTTSPAAKLDVNGNTSTRCLTITGGCDLAEPFPMNERQIEAGSVVVIDEEHPGQLARSSRAYDTRVAGIISGANGVHPGIALKQEGTFDQGQNVALTGRVYVQADASYGPINPGDLLTTSDTPGHAMKVMDHAKAQGAILGKAMSALNHGRGMVLVLVTLQ